MFNHKKKFTDNLFRTIRAHDMYEAKQTVSVLARSLKETAFHACVSLGIKIFDHLKIVGGMY